MVTFYNSKTYLIKGTSADKKPILEKESNGSKFIEMDTNKVYYYDGENKKWICVSK